MANTLSQQQVESVLRPYGFTGSATGGAAQAFINSNPTAARAFNAVASAPVAQTYQRPATTMTGAQPVGIEPLHQWEKSGLTSKAAGVDTSAMQQALKQLQAFAANPQSYASQYTSPWASQFMPQAGTYTAQGAAPVTQQEVMDFQNPFASELENQLSEQAKATRAAILAAQGNRGAASFGDTSTGQRFGALDTAELLGKGDIRYKTFQDALAAVQQGRERSLAAGGQFGQLATTGQGIFSNAASTGMQAPRAAFEASSYLGDIQRQNAADRIAAGTAVRGYNQGVTDIALQERLNKTAFTGQQLADLVNMLRGYGSTNAVTPQANTIGQIGRIASGGASVMDELMKALSSGGTKKNPSIRNAATGEGINWSVMT